MSAHGEPEPMTARKGTALKGVAEVPGDKSISHRSLILGAMAVGETKVTGLLEGQDVLDTAAAMRAFGADVIRDGDLPTKGLELGARLGAEPWPVNVGGGEAGLGKPGVGLIRFSTGILARHAEEEAVGRVGGEVGESELGEGLDGIALGDGIALEDCFAVRRFDHVGPTAVMQEGEFMVAVADRGSGHEPEFALRGAEGLQEELDRTGGGRFEVDSKVKRGGQAPEFRPFRFRGGPVVVDQDLVASPLEEPFEGALLSGRKEEGRGVGTERAEGAGAVGVEGQRPAASRSLRPCRPGCVHPPV